jgi:hypothetical protein
MADETQVNSNPPQETKTSEVPAAGTQTPPPPPSTPPGNQVVKPKSKKMLFIVLAVLGLFIIGAGIFFATQTNAPQSPAPSPTVTQKDEAAPTIEPTVEAVTPTVQVSKSPLPSISQPTAPSISQETPSPAL